MSTVLNPDFREFLELLNGHSVKYILVGGYALAFHGHPRYTKDLDVWVGTGAKNAHNLIAALNEFGFGDLAISAGDFLNEDMVVQLGHPPTRIDILTSVSGLQFDDAYPNHVVHDLDGLEIAFIGLKDLKANKKAAGRYQDLADLEELGGDE